MLTELLRHCRGVWTPFCCVTILYYDGIKMKWSYLSLVFCILLLRLCFIKSKPVLSTSFHNLLSALPKHTPEALLKPVLCHSVMTLSSTSWKCGLGTHAWDAPWRWASPQSHPRPMAVGCLGQELTFYVSKINVMYIKLWELTTLELRGQMVALNSNTGKPALHLDSSVVSRTHILSW